MVFDETFYTEHYRYLKTFEDIKYQEKYPELFTEDFTNFCRKKVLPVLRENNIESPDKISEKYVIYFILAFLSIIPCFLFSIELASSLKLSTTLTTFIYISTGIITTLFFFIIAVSKIRKDFKKQWNNMKNKVFPIILLKIPNSEYLNKNSINYSLLSYLKKLKLVEELGTLQKNYEEDRFKIKYNGTTLDIGEYFLSGVNIVTKKEKEKNKTRTQLSKYIREEEDYEAKEGAGITLFLRAKLKKRLKGKTTIQKKILERDAIKSKDDDVILESTEFNKIFKVTSTNQQEARLILTPIFMEFLIKFSKENKNCNINISYEKGYINIFFTNKGYHEKFEFFQTNETLYKDIVLNCRAILIELKELIHLYTILDLK